jgi:hypothetical protein
MQKRIRMEMRRQDWRRQQKRLMDQARLHDLHLQYVRAMPGRGRPLHSERVRGALWLPAAISPSNRERAELQCTSIVWSTAVPPDSILTASAAQRKRAEQVSC